MRPLSRFVYSLTSSLSLLACVSAAHAENWPEFRGPGRQGISEELLGKALRRGVAVLQQLPQFAAHRQGDARFEVAAGDRAHSPQ